MTFTALVVDRCTALHDFDKFGTVDRGLPRRDSCEHFLDQVDCGTAITVGHRNHRDARIIVERQRAAFECFRADKEFGQCCIVEAMEGEDAGSR